MRAFLCFIFLFISSHLSGMTNLVIKDLREFSSAFTYQTYDTTHFWDRHGHRRDSYNNFKCQEWILYSELGLTSKDTIGAQFIFAHNEDCMSGNITGLEDIELTWKRLVFQRGPHHIATQVTAILPVEADFTPTLRYGRFGGELAAIYYNGFTLNSLPGWYDFKLGYRFYQGFPSDQIRTHFRIGYALGSYFQIFAGTFLDYGIFNGHSHLSSSIFAFFPNYRLWTAEIQAVLCICNHVYFSLGYCQHLWGANVATGGGVFASAAIDF